MGAKAPAGDAEMGCMMNKVIAFVLCLVFCLIPVAAQLVVSWVEKPAPACDGGWRTGISGTPQVCATCHSEEPNEIL